MINEQEAGRRWEGVEGRECGEHGTLGRRAWCSDCQEYCYPNLPCKGCRLPKLEAALAAANKRIEELEAKASLADEIGISGNSHDKFWWANWFDRVVTIDPVKDRREEQPK